MLSSHILNIMYMRKRKVVLQAGGLGLGTSPSGPGALKSSQLPPNKKK